MNKYSRMRRARWHMLLIPTLRIQGEADLCDFKVNLTYIMSSRPAGDT